MSSKDKETQTQTSMEETSMLMEDFNIDQDTDSPPDEDQVSPEPHEGFQAWLQVIGGFCLNLNTWGLMNAYGVFQTHYTLQLLIDNSSSEIAWIGSVQAFLMFAVSFIIGPIFDAGYLRTLLLIGSFLSVFGFFMTSLCSEYWQVFLAQGVTMGIGFGCLYLPAPALISMYFKKNIGLAMGIASCGSGIGGVIYPLAFTRLLPYMGFGAATRVLAYILLGMSVVPLLVMRFPHSQTLDRPSPQQINRQTGLINRISRLTSSLIDKSAFSDTPYLTLNFGLATGYMGIYTILYYIDQFAQYRTETSLALSFYMIVIINAATIVGRVLPAALADRIGAAHVLGLTSLACCILVFSILAVKTSVGIVVWSVIFGVPAGAFQGLPAAGVVSVSNKGTARIGVRIGMTLLMAGVGVLIAGPIAGAILYGPGNWPGLVGWGGSLLAASAFFMLVARMSKVGLTIRVAI